MDHFECNNPGCVKPAHLRVVTHAENVFRKGGLPGVYARATHCPRGHLFSEENTYRGPTNPTRVCKICRKVAGINYGKRNPERIKAQGRKYVIKHKSYVAAYRRAYYVKNKKRIDAQRSLLRQKKRESR